MMEIGNECVDLRLCLMDSAQCFHWVERDGRFGAVLCGEAVWIWQEGGVICAETDLPKDVLRRYLDLERDYSALAEEYARFPKAAQAVRLFPGMRVLNQPAWEALIAFILSANNNVRRIRNLVTALCRGYGEAKETALGTLYAFPKPEVLARCGADELRALGVGYRDRYLVGTARMVAEGFPLDDLRGMPYEDGHAALRTLPGVGDKVADCVQLFGCGQTEAYPVDVWIERMTSAVFGLAPCSRQKLGAQARVLLGGHAGLLQQFLFHAARTGAMEL